MTDGEIKNFLVDALNSANVIGILDDKRIPGFLDGHEDIPFSELDIDSLAKMELCISIEVFTGVSISPDELVYFKTMSKLVDFIMGQLP